MQHLLLTLILLTASSGTLTLDEINTSYFGNLAIEGYDSAAYFTEQHAVKGDREHETNYKEVFINDADRYWPQLLQTRSKNRMKKMRIELFLPTSPLYSSSRSSLSSAARKRL